MRLGIVIIFMLLFPTNTSTDRVHASIVSGPMVVNLPTTRLVDDYPWKNASGGTDTWGYTTRQCVSFVAFRLSQNHQRVVMWGSALYWDQHLKAVSPRVGAIAQWNEGESSQYYTAAGTGRIIAGNFGHVAYVSKVYSDGSVLIEQYNLDKERAYSTMRVKAPRYLSS